MPSFCCIINCSNGRTKETNHSFFRFPAICNKSKAENLLSIKRRRLWMAAINRKNCNTLHARVCSEHFISGKSAKLKDALNPDWVPTLQLGYIVPKNPTQNLKRFERQKNRASKISATVSISTDSATCELDNSSTEVLSYKDSTSQTEIFGNMIEYYQNIIENKDRELKKANLEIIQKDEEIKIKNMKIHQLEGIIKVNNVEIQDMKTEARITNCHRVDIINMDFFNNDDKKTNYFTGLSHFKTLKIIYQTIENNLPSSLKLNKFQIFIMTLMKLRLDLPFKYLAYKFGTSIPTLSKNFYECLFVLDKELGTFVSWPKKEVRIHYTPEHFKNIFGDRLAVIIDCFEVFIEKPGNQLAKASVYSNYKNHETLKFLIGIAPSGSIIYISNAFGGRCSDKFITENSDFLCNIEPGDIILSDRGFLIEQAVEKVGAEVTMPAFKGKKAQLDAFDVEDTRQKAEIRIHVERVIGLIRQKYLIVSNKQPITCVGKKMYGNSCYDAIVRVCCALVNLSPSVIKHAIVQDDDDDIE